jgi:hypothetical protein
MLSYGWQHAWFLRERGRLPPPVDGGAASFPPPERFEPQKRIALSRARLVAWTLGAVLAAGLIVSQMR